MRKFRSNKKWPVLINLLCQNHVDKDDLPKQINERADRVNGLVLCDLLLTF